MLLHEILSQPKRFVVYTDENIEGVFETPAGAIFRILMICYFENRRVGLFDLDERLPRKPEHFPQFRNLLPL